MSSNEVSGVRLNSQRRVMTARSQFIWVLSSAWQKVVKNMLTIGWNVFEQSVTGVLSKLWRSGVSVMMQVELNRASYVCFNPTFIWWSCKAPPGWRSVEELGEHHRLVKRLQRITVHSVTTHDFHTESGLAQLHSICPPSFHQSGLFLLTSLKSLTTRKGVFITESSQYLRNWRFNLNVH